MAEEAKWTRFIYIVRIVGVFQFFISSYLMTFFVQEMIIGFLQITNFEPIVWLFMFTTSSFTLLWNALTGLGLLLEAHTWRFVTTSTQSKQKKSVPASKPTTTTTSLINESTENSNVCLYSFVTWGLSIIIFLLIDLIGNFILFLNGPYEIHLALTWIIPMILLALVTNNFPVKKQEEKELLI